YIPLGGNRRGLTRTLANILITMALGGLWHGASWTFLLWGIWHGLGLVVLRLWRRLGYELSTLAGVVITNSFVFAGWLLFRAQDWPGFKKMLAGLLGSNGLSFSDAYSAASRPTEFATIVIAAIVVCWPLTNRARFDAVKIKTVGWWALPLWLISLW